MNSVKIKSEEINKFVGANHGAFLQSFEWGEFQAKSGAKVIRLGFKDKGELVAGATLIKKKLFFGKSYFYCPRGPITHGKRENAGKIFEEIEKQAKNENCVFLRFEPDDELLAGLSNPPDVAEKLTFERTIDIQPSRTLMLDLKKSEEELLEEMHQKTRYNIRLAEKKNVGVSELPIADFDCFWRLANETKDRDNFRLHPKDYYCRMLECGCQGDVSCKDGINNELGLKLFTASYENKIIAASLVAFFGDTATYVHGASSNECRNVMAPYLLQWHCIKLAKSLGYKRYDFYGIDEAKWPGVTRFKKGFGGKEVQYPGTFDLVFDKKWFRIYKSIRWVRRKLRF